MDFTSNVMNICCRGHSKRPCSPGRDSLSARPVKSPRCKNMDRARAVANVTASYLDGIRKSCRIVTDSNVRVGANVEVDIKYDRVRYRSSVVVGSIRLARDVAREVARRDGCRDWNNPDMMDYVRRSKYLGSRRFGIFPVEGQVARVVVDGKSWFSVNGALNMRTI